MKRVHLFEFEDQSWFPERLREAMTAYLVAAYGLTPLPKLWADRIAMILPTGGPAEIVDLGSGAGGPVALILRELEALGVEVRVTLTDLYPNPGRLSGREGSVRYWPEPVDATRVPEQLGGVRTLFSAFHHFPPEAGREILQDAFKRRRPICIFEAASRTPLAIVSMLVVPLVVLFLMPSVRPFSWFRIVFTYLVPILPLLIFWDGFVSQLRAYRPEELRDLTASLKAPDYEWQIGELRAKGLPGGLPYLIGCSVAVARD